MDFFLVVVQSPGYIFGPLMLLAGLTAVVLCVRATRRPDRVRARRALVWALVPPVVGMVGAICGAIVKALTDQPNKDWSAALPHLGGTILFGVFVALVPALWALVLFQRRPTALA
jgi:uncharacterized membrane protein